MQNNRTKRISLHSFVGEDFYPFLKETLSSRANPMSPSGLHLSPSGLQVSPCGLQVSPRGLQVSPRGLTAGSIPSSIKILMVGDVVGRGGRKILKKVLAKLRESIELDLVTINGENLAGGFGITEKIYHEMMESGVDVITMGNHWKDKSDVHHLRQKYKNLVLPHNLKGVSNIEKAPQFYLPRWGKNVNVINLMGTYAMKEEYGNPFDFLIREKENFLDKVASRSHIVIADIHAEASSEKQAIAWFYDGILSGMIGTHTHVPTCDERITDKGTAFLSDVGMTGPYYSVIGMDAERVIKRLSQPQGVKVSYEVAEHDLWFCGFLIEVDPETCLANACYRLQCRGVDTEQHWLVSRVLL